MTYTSSNSSLEDRKKSVGKALKTIREGIKLAMMATGLNVTEFDKKTIKLFSPRMLSVMPDEDADHQINLLSPSLLSLHNDGKGIERKFSIPNAIKMLHDRDQEQLMDFIIEASGVNDAVDRMRKEKNDRRKTFGAINDRGIDGQPMFFSKENVTEISGAEGRKKIETFERLIKSYTPEQVKRLNETGIAIMNSNQLQILYGPESAYFHSEALRRLTNITSDSHRFHDLLHGDIEQLAQAEAFRIRRNRRRHKRFGVALSPFVLSPIILNPGAASQPIVLSPLVLSPLILSPAVLGPIILSPWVFTPVILSPRLLAPIILNPIVLSPIILTPMAFNPFILVPGVLSPFILSPFALSPVILSPQAASPIILSPFALSPIIFNPMTMSPLILSPFILSPIICSPQYIFGVILSPYAYSPIIESNFTLSEVILSPSFMS
ncbi:hypothetical protein AB6A40_003067 [Gnathostoma spinigerum]|uniref:Uncharacterized protein n=1 Tax=Gnathostoma spinigerum TaxID=75299 RepID=A0ABD6E8F4_9BILA